MTEFKVGDRVRDGAEFEKGEIVLIDDDPTFPIFVRLPDRKYVWYAADELEKIEDEEVAE